MHHKNTEFDAPEPGTFAQVYAALNAPLLRACMADTPNVDAAQDAAEDAWLALWRRWGWSTSTTDPTRLRSYAEPSLYAFLLSVAKRELRRSWYRARREDTLNDMEVAA